MIEQLFNNIKINTLVDDKIKKEIIEQIDIFYKRGSLEYKNSSLYGKIFDVNENEYLEIKNQDNVFICNYTLWNCDCKINIVQIKLDNNFTKIIKKQKKIISLLKNLKYLKMNIIN